jgi:NAD(P)-dependent dehydrogenase (short-subunit alcohol dehydrogenase family)
MGQGFRLTIEKRNAKVFAGRNRMSKEKNKRVAIVTGGAEGIGQCICRYFAQAGVNVIIADKNTTTGRKAQKSIGPDTLFIRTDVSNEAAVKNMVVQTIRRFGRIDYVVNNAAIAKNTPIEKLSFADWTKVIHTNLSAAFLCAKHAAKYLRKTQGTIVNIASSRALMSEANTEAYSASKGGIVALTHAMAVSLGPSVRVNCISPGWIDTRDYTAMPKFPPLTETDHAQHLVGRVGRPEDIAEMVLYLCSDKSGFVTGQNFIIDGGMTKKMIYV